MAPDAQARPSPRSAYGVFSDPIGMAQAIGLIPAWSSDPRPVGIPARGFRATMANAAFDRYGIGVGEYSAAIPYAGTTGNQHTFMYPILPGTARWVSGWEITGRRIFHLRADERMATNSPPGMRRAAGVIAISFDELRARTLELTGMDRRVERDADRMFQVPGRAMARLVGLTHDLARVVRDTPWLIEEPRTASALSGSILDALIGGLVDGHARPDRAALGRHRAILARFERLVEENPEEVLSLGAICQRIGVAERTLNLVCAELLGESAVLYARGRRLDRVRARLLDSDPATTTVTEVATHYGFWELGRFAQVYVRRFGERPSRTLRRQD